MDPNFVVEDASSLIANPKSEHPSISAGKLMPMLFEYFSERAREHLHNAETLYGSFGFHNLNPSAGLFGKLHSSKGCSKELSRVTETIESLGIVPTKVSRKKMWGSTFCH